MRLLLIHTCGAEGVLALADERGVTARQALPGRGAGEEILPALRRLFREAGWTPLELTAVAVVVGPGSFTGIRVGLSAAKGLVEAAGCSFVGVSRLMLLGAMAAARAEPLALADAGRGEVFCGWRDPDGAWVERLLSAEAARALLPGRAAVCCEAQVRMLLGAEVELYAEPDADVLWSEAMRRIAQGAWDDVAAADANYLRRTDAEIMEERP